MAVTSNKKQGPPQPNTSKENLKWARGFNKIADKVTKIAGSPIVSILAFLIVIVWALCGPLFNYSETWQLVINTGTTIITFLMVFIIQQAQNRDTTAIHLKLNELIASNEDASNRLIDIEDLTEQELRVLKSFYIRLSEKAEADNDLYSSHSIDEADENHQEKRKRRKEEEKEK